MKNFLDYFWTILIATFLAVSLYLSVSDFGIQRFGNKAQFLSAISSVFFAIFLVIRIAGHLRKTRSHYIHPSGLLLFGLVLILAPLVSGENAVSAILSTKTRTSNLSLVKDLVRNGGKSQIATEVQANPFTNKKPTAPSSDIKIENAQFMKKLEDIYANPSNYFGTKLQFEGILVPMEAISSDIFLAGRLAILCCPGDGMPIGILAKFQTPVSNKIDQWYQIDGEVVAYEIPDDVLDNFSFQAGEKVPLIQITSLKPMKMPKDPYLYP